MYCDSDTSSGAGRGYTLTAGKDGAGKNRDVQQKEEESKIVRVKRLNVWRRAKRSSKYAGMR